MREEVRTDLEEISSPRVLFIPPHEINPTEISVEEDNPIEKHCNTGTIPPLSTNPYPPHSHQIKPSEAPYTAPPRLCIDSRTTACLVRSGDLPRVHLTASTAALFGVYQDWVHQNPDINLDEIIGEDGKWQRRWKNLFVSPPNNMMYHLAGLGLFCLDTRGGSRRYTRSEMEL